MRALNSPLENIDDPDEQLVAALVAHLAPTIATWRSGEDLREERMAIEQVLPGLQSEVAALESRGAALATERDGAFKSPMVLALGGAGALLFLLGFVVSAVGGFGILIGGTAMAFAGYSYVQARSALAKKIQEVENLCAGKAEELGRATERAAAIDRELAGRGGGFPEVMVGRVAFPLKMASIAGSDVIVDTSSAMPAVPLRTLDLSSVGSEAASIVREAKKMSQVPVLLEPNSEMSASEPVDRLYGEEDRLRALVDAFVQSLSRISDVGISLPLVPRHSEVARRMASGPAHALPGNCIPVHGEAAGIGQIGAFVRQANAAKSSGEGVLGQFQEAHGLLSAACGTFSAARLESINHLHRHVYEVLNRAAWCSMRYYCPRAIQSSAYLEDLLDIAPDEAYLLDFDTLDHRLRADPVIAKRVEDRPELIDALYIAHRALALDFQPSAGTADPGVRTSADSGGLARSQREESVKQFALALSKVLTGAAQPVLGFSEEARLFYDPGTQEWRSGGAPYAYTTAQVQKYGQVLKVHSDLLVPLWELLWIEKADFRKSETFRTNESLIRMAEKESEKIIEIGNQFRADMRSVRENVYLLDADLRVKLDELRQFRDSMKAVGLLSARQEDSLDDAKLRNLAMGDASVIARGEEIESYLGYLPKAQAESRGLVKDPIDLARSPDALISYGGGARHLLGSPGTREAADV